MGMKPAGAVPEEWASQTYKKIETEENIIVESDDAGMDEFV